MSDAFIYSVITTSYGHALSLLAEMLVQAGWSYRASGDGLAAYSATGKVFTGTGTGAGGWNNSRAWCRLGDPESRREIVIQHNGAGGLRLKYSALAKFTGGTPSANTVPSATDERVLWGAGTDGTPTLSAFMPTTVPLGGTKFQGHARGSAPYGFYWTGFATPAGATQVGIMLDPVTSVPEDPDPVVFHIGTTTAFWIGGFGRTQGGTTTTDSTHFPNCGATQAGTWGYMDPGLAAFGYVMPMTFGAGAIGTGNQSGGNGQTLIFTASYGGHVVNPFNGKHETLPLLWARPTVSGLANCGFKGWSTFCRWTTIARTTGLDTIDGKKWICHGSVWLPWDGVTVPTN